jgi:hypothetical protein
MDMHHAAGVWEEADLADLLSPPYALSHKDGGASKVSVPRETAIMRVSDCDRSPPALRTADSHDDPV